jgi:hypothetical protein
VDRELRADGDLDPGERADLLAWAEGVLEEELSGKESKEEVEEIVNNILDEEFGEDDDPDEEDAEDFDEEDEDADDDSGFE